MTTINKHWDSLPNEDYWKCILISPIGICVSYMDELGFKHNETCIGLWENKTQYKLTWKDAKNIILQKSNITSLEYSKI